jgi:hypothetical protein
VTKDAYFASKLVVSVANYQMWLNMVEIHNLYNYYIILTIPCHTLAEGFHGPLFLSNSCPYLPCS